MLRKYIFWTIIGLIINALFVIFYAVEVLPLGLVSFLILSVLILFVTYHRPKEMFWVFLISLPLEIIIVSPHEALFTLRPYQWLGGILLLVMLAHGLDRSKKFVLMKWKDYNLFDRLVFIFPLFAFLSLINAPSQILSFKLAVILVSFILLYWLVRHYTRTVQEKLEAVWFFLASSKIVIAFGLYQAVATKVGWLSFQVMEGRINSTFTEPDWLGMYLVVLLAITFWVKLYTDHFKSDLRWGNWPLQRALEWLINWAVFWIIFALILTVARSAWLAALVVFIIYLVFVFRKHSPKKLIEEGVLNAALAAIAFLVVIITGLSSFHLADRATSTVSGMQKITISCAPGSMSPEQIGSTEELAQYNCRHINLGEIESEKAAGNVVAETYRPDPNVSVRKRTYTATWGAIKQHPILGQGLGTSRIILGQDERGTPLNTSNIFFEVWISMGILGLAVFIAIFIGPIAVIKRRWQKSGYKETMIITFAILTSTAFFIPNLFNSGLLLGIFWAWLAVIISMTDGTEQKRN